MIEMLSLLSGIYLSCLCVIFGGIANMIFTKTIFYSFHRRPIDAGIRCPDGKPLFGSNKTWIGFFSMMLFCCLFQILTGWMIQQADISNMAWCYRTYENTLLFNIIYGLTMGAAYMLFELPNSFIKRRLSIKPGENAPGIKGIVSFIVDQMDSMFGIFIVVAITSPLSPLEYLAGVLVGGVTHIIVNAFLIAVKVRKRL